MFLLLQFIAVLYQIGWRRFSDWTMIKPAKDYRTLWFGWIACCCSKILKAVGESQIAHVILNHTASWVVLSVCSVPLAMQLNRKSEKVRGDTMNWIIEEKFPHFSGYHRQTYVWSSRERESRDSRRKERKRSKTGWSEEGYSGRRFHKKTSSCYFLLKLLFGCFLAQTMKDAAKQPGERFVCLFVCLFWVCVYVVGVH